MERTRSQGPGRYDQPATNHWRRLTMHSIKRLLAVMGTIVALMALAPVASAGSPAPFLLTKTCVSDFLCTVVSSTFDGFPAGTDIVYTVTGDGSDGLAYPPSRSVPTARRACATGTNPVPRCSRSARSAPEPELGPRSISTWMSR